MGIKFIISCHQITMRKVLMDCARRLSLYLTLSTDKALTRTQIKSGTQVLTLNTNLVRTRYSSKSGVFYIRQCRAKRQLVVPKSH